MQYFKLKKQSVISTILSTGILAPCLLGMYPQSVWAEHLDLPSVDVRADRIYEISARPLNTRDAAGLLEAHPSVDLYQAGGVSALPSICGL